MTPAPNDADRLRSDLRGIRNDFAARLKAARQAAAAAGLDGSGPHSTDALFDGPLPEALTGAAIAPDARLFSSPTALVRSLFLGTDAEVGAILPSDAGTIGTLLLGSPRVVHIFDPTPERFDAGVRAHPSARIHDGDPVERLGALADGSLDYVAVDGPVSHAGAQRLFAALLPKVRHGRYIGVRNYTSWSVLSGIPYGIVATVNALVNAGVARVVGFMPHPLGYHQILLRKADGPIPDIVASAGTSPLTAHPRASSPLLESLPRRPDALAPEPAEGDPSARLVRIAALLEALHPRPAAVLVADGGEAGPLSLAPFQTGRFELPPAGASDSGANEETPALIGRFLARVEEGWTHFVVSGNAFDWLDRQVGFSAFLLRSFRLVSLDADAAILSLREPSPWNALESLLDELLASEGTPQAILDWGTGRNLAAALPDRPVFTPPGLGEVVLPYLDATVPVVAIPAGDGERLTEARRVATAAVVEIGGDPHSVDIEIRVQRLPGQDRPPATARIEAVSTRGTPLADRSILICSYCLPQPDCDSYSRRLFHFVGFLLDAGCEVTCVASQSAAHDAFAKLLTGRGVRVLVGLDTNEIAALARDGRFDWALIGFWHTAAPLLPLLRQAAPATRIIVDSGDLHFLRAARARLRDADGNAGGLDHVYESSSVREINTYAAADGVLTVSRKEADLVADLLADDRRTFAVPDSEDLDLSPIPFRSRRGMFFVGNFGHAPNAEALEHLCRRILPHLDPSLLEEHPLYIAGSNLNAAHRAVAAWPGVRVLGWVPSVVPYLQGVRVSLIPLLNGAGTKRKMIQALSIGTPTVSTTIGLEGFPLADEEQVLVADDPVAFAAGITRLLTDGELWARLSAAGRETIRAHHAPAVARNRLLTALESVRTRPRRRPAPPQARTIPVDTRVTVPLEGLTPDHVVTRAPAAPRPRISVVIPSRDRAPFLREALASLVGQSVDADTFEVVVIDDGSTDGTAEVCREFAGRLRLTSVSGPPSGIGRAKNIGIELAAAELLLFFDDDDVADPGLLAAHLAAHARYPLEHVAVLGFTDWHPRLEPSEVMRYVTDVGHQLFSYTSLDDGQILDHTWFWGGRSSCKRSLILRAGGFRPEFTFGSEDIEAGYRIGRMVADERRASGLEPNPSLAVVFRRDAVQHMVRPVTFDEFCRRCERQGRSQWRYSRLYDDSSVTAWCQVEGAEARWEAARPNLAGWIAEVHALERMVAEGRGDRRAIRQDLHALYRRAFEAFKAKGIVAEASAAEA